MPLTHDTAWLEKLHEQFVEAFRSNDLKALGAWYAEDAVLLPPGRGVVAGRDAIVEFWKGAEHLQDLVFETTDSRLTGTILREAGNLLVTSRGQGRETVNTAAKYVTVWIEKDGAWKIDSTIWNGAGGGGAGRRGGGRRGGGPGGAGGPGGRPGRGGGGGGRGRQGRGGGGGGRGRQNDAT